MPSGGRGDLAVVLPRSPKVYGCTGGVHVVDGFHDVDLARHGPVAVHALSAFAVWALTRQHPKRWPDTLPTFRRQEHHW